jgi:hypothetical protein
VIFDREAELEPLFDNLEWPSTLTAVVREALVGFDEEAT